MVNSNSTKLVKNNSFQLFKSKKSFNKVILVFLILLIIEVLYDSINAIDINYLKKPSLFVDEICSYNGVMNASLSNETYIKCDCNPEYATVKSEKGLINGVPIQCSYFRKRKFITVFFSIFLPFGVEYLYLEHYYFFAIIFIMCCTAIVGNCIRFTVSSGQEKYFKSKLNLFFFILLIVMIIFSIINIILMFIGVKDGNDIEVLDDLHLLVNIQTERSDT